VGTYEFDDTMRIRFGATAGTWSEVTDTEAGHDRSVTLAVAERALVTNYFGVDQIHRGASSDDPAAVKRFYSDDGNPLDLKITMPKPRGGETRLYFTSSTLNPAAGDIFYLYIKSGLIHVGSMTPAAWTSGGTIDEDDAAYQSEVEQAQAGMQVAEKTQSVYVRDRAKAVSVLNAASGCCLDSSHLTFTSRLTGKPFLEAHHVIPVNATPRFPGKNLDETDNIVALCPSCHRQIHHGSFDDIKIILSQLLKSRYALLNRLGLGEQGVFDCYGIPS